MHLEKFTGSKSLKKTLNIQIGFVVLSIGFIIGILFFLFSFHMEKKDFQNSIQLQTKHLADTFTQQLWLFDHNTTQQLADLATESPDISGLRIRDHHNNTIVESGVFSKTATEKITKELRYEDKTLVGYLSIFFVNPSWTKQKSIIILTAICTMGFIIMASFLLISSILNRHLVKPLDDLQKDMNSVKSGAFNQSGIVQQKTEIQNIVDGFNRMASALANREETQKKAEKELLKEKNFVEALIHTLPGLFYVYENGQHMVRWNQNFEIASGLTSSEMLNKAPEGWVAEKDKATVIQVIQKTLKQGNSSIEVDLQLKAGPVPYFLTASNYNTGNKNFILGVGIDLTQRKKLEKALQQSQKMESIGTLAGGIAHDFNNILFPMIGYAEMLQEDLPKNSPQKNSVNEILRAGLRAKDLVQQILTISRRSDQELKPVRVQSILKEAVKLLTSSIPKTIKIETNIDSTCDLVIADPTQIHQIIMNLSTNAYHAMQNTGGVLKIVLEQVEIQKIPGNILRLNSGVYVLLKIIDNGSGIKKTVIDKIFDPYFTTKKMGKGTGLGLSIVQGIVQSCNGDVTVYSEEDMGTEVHVYLPIIEKSYDVLMPQPEKNIQKGTERILLVDDEEAIVKMEKQLLERLGYVVTAENGSQQALETFKSHPDRYDLIITDMTMPDMTGLQLAEELKLIRPDIPIVICTGFSDQINLESSKNFNIQGYITKPIVKSQISEIIRSVLDNIDKKP